MPGEPLDFIAFVIALLAFVTSREIAVTIGPHAAIVVLACAGAALSISQNDKPMTGRESVMYVTVRVLVAVVLTVSIAQLVERWVPIAKASYTLSPIAFAIGWIKDYREFFRAIVERIPEWFKKAPK